MAENKYITQTQEHGSVLISEEVLVNIISLAVAEVEGAELSGKPFRTFLLYYITSVKWSNIAICRGRRLRRPVQQVKFGRGHIFCRVVEGADPYGLCIEQELI